MLFHDPPPGISAWAREENGTELEALMQGAAETPFAGGSFRLQLQIPPRYPFEPPKVHFVTPIYHPNIDTAGRICLDILNMPPKGAWKPSLNISTVLSSIQLLMSHPNPDDGLMVDITHQYIHAFAEFQRDAVEHTRRHAAPDAGGAAGGGGSGGGSASSSFAAGASAARPTNAAMGTGDDASSNGEAAKRQRVE